MSATSSFPPTTTCIAHIHTCIHTYIRTYVHTYIHTLHRVTLVLLEEMVPLDLSERRGPLEILVRQGPLVHEVPQETKEREAYRVPPETMVVMEVRECEELQVWMISSPPLSPLPPPLWVPESIFPQVSLQGTSWG